MIKENVLMIVLSLVSILLLSIHITQDIIRGADRWGSQSLFVVLIFVVLLYGTLLLPERRSGLVIMLLGGLFAACMPVLHNRVSLVKSGTSLFIWTLFALGATGSLTIILAVRALLRRRPEGKIMTAAENESPDRRR